MVDQAADRAHRAGRGRLGRLDVGVYGSAIFGIVPNILARFSRENPDVEIALCNAMSSSGKLAYSSTRQQLK
ncbi:hypothetical protein [Acidovorax sp.]|uniref:hypothetical protein n=1 Tax=Acidovorax sp. TaxID=1872122 RepID=UPI003D05B112